MIEYIRDFDPKTPIDSDAIRVFLARHRVRPIDAPAGFLRFRRSSRFATMFAMRPSRWCMEIHVALSVPSVTMVVHSTGQIVTRRERRYFQAFFDELVSFIATQNGALAPIADHSIARREGSLAFSENVGGVMLGFCIPFILLALVLFDVPFFIACVIASVGPFALYYAWAKSARRRTEYRLGKQVVKRVGVSPRDRRITHEM